MKALARMTHGTDHAIELAAGIADDCKAITDADRCEMSYKLANCFVENAVKRSLDPKKII